MSKVILSLGSNKGNRFQYITTALLSIQKLPDTYIVKISSFYETEPYKVEGQNNFINLVAIAETQLALVKIFNFLLEIEKKLGRTSKGDLKSREIDIDILFYDDFILESEQLTIPHKDLQNRIFVLQPLCEIEPDFIHPVFKKSIKELLSQLNTDLKVNKLY